MSQSSSNDPRGSEQGADTDEAVTPEASQATDAPDQVEDQPVEAASVEQPEAEHAEVDDHGSSPSFAGMALRFLIIVLVVFAVAIWALPRVAPHLPENIAKNLFPMQQVVDERLAALEAKVEGAASAEIAALTSEVSALKGQVGDLQAQLEAAQADASAAKAAAEEAASAAGRVAVSETVLADAGAAAGRAAEAADVATSAATEAGTVASSAMRNSAALARRVTGFEAQMLALSEEVSALGDGLVTAGSGSGESAGTSSGSPELAAAYTALKARLDGLAAQVGGSGYLTETEAAKFATQDDLRATRTALESNLATAMGKLPDPGQVGTVAQIDGVETGLSEQIAAISGRLDDVEAAATSAAESAASARSEVGGAIRNASLRSAVAALKARMQTGLPFSASLHEVAALSEQPAPDALAATADSGVATSGALLATFGRSAQDAVAADLRASADGNFLGQATARLRSLAAGRPQEAQEGDDVTAILSRVEAAVTGGELTSAVSQVDALPEAAAAAMDDWISKLKARVAADAALTDYVAGLGGTDG